MYVCMYVHMYVASIFFSIGMFSIDDEGKITTDVILDRENTDSYLLMVETVDMGSPPQTCSVNINITVLDTNDNTPSFVNCEGPHSVTEVSFCHAQLIFKVPLLLECYIWN